MGGGDNRGPKDDSVRKLSLESERTVRAVVPFESFEFDLLSSPEGGDVSVGEIGEAEVRPDSLRQIDNDITLFVPRREYAELCFALRIHRAVQKADARVAAARVRQDEQWRIRRPLRSVIGPDLEAGQGSDDFVMIQTDRRVDLRDTKAMIPNHVLQPETKLGIVFWTSRIQRL